MNELFKETLAGKVSKDSDIVLDVFDGNMAFRNRTEKEADTKRIVPPALSSTIPQHL